MDRPILFSAPMVRALLAGTKTQTRRLTGLPQIELMPNGSWHISTKGGGVVTTVFGANPEAAVGTMAAGYCTIQPGDRLWVKETCLMRQDVDYRTAPEKAAHYAMFFADSPGAAADENHWHPYPTRWTPSIHMPRAISRLTLHVTDVRVERLQAISEADAMAEGIEHDPKRFQEHCPFGVMLPDGMAVGSTAKRAYLALWWTINGEKVEDENPWVAAYTFTVERANIGSARP